jgi:quercetin dioxygenase-like cupin family protein
MRTFLAIALGIVVGIGSFVLAGQDAPRKGPAKRVADTPINEKIDGKASKVTTVELVLEPGHSGSPHRHPGPVFGYVLEGEYEWAINDQPVKRLKAGETFYEPTMSLHRVSRNPSDKVRARVLAVLLVPRDAKQLSIPEKHE